MADLINPAQLDVFSDFTFFFFCIPQPQQNTAKNTLAAKSLCKFLYDYFMIYSYIIPSQVELTQNLERRGFLDRKQCNKILNQ